MYAEDRANVGVTGDFMICRIWQVVMVRATAGALIRNLSCGVSIRRYLGQSHETTPFENVVHCKISLE
jgi:hypothetical protein